MLLNATSALMSSSHSAACWVARLLASAALARPSAAVAGDALYVAALRGERLWQVPLAGGDPVPLLQGQYGRLRAAATAPDGALWLLTSNRDGRGDPTADDDRVLRLAVA